MASTTPSQDGVENGASSMDGVEESSIKQRSFKDGRSVSATSQSPPMLNLAGPSSSSNISEGTFQAETQLLDDQPPLDLFSFGDVTSHSSQSFASSVVNTTGYDSSHEFGAISSTLPPVFENLFGQSPPDDVGAAFSIDDVVHTGYAPWDDIDVLSVGLNVPKVLMQGSEMDGGVDESDGTSSHLPDSSSSKSGKSKARGSLVPNSTNASNDQVPVEIGHDSSPFRQPLLPFEDGSPDYEQCSSSSDLSITKLPPPRSNAGDKMSSSTSSPSAPSTSRRAGRESLIDHNETPSKILQFIEPDPIDPNNFFDMKSFANDDGTVSSQKPTASSSSDLFSNDLLNSRRADFSSLPESVESRFKKVEGEGCKLVDEASGSSQPSVPYHHEKRDLSSPSASASHENSVPARPSNSTKSPPGEFPISSPVSQVSPPSVVGGTLGAETIQQSRVDHPFHKLAPPYHNTADVDKGSSEISTSSTKSSVVSSHCSSQQGETSSKLSPAALGEKSTDDDWKPGKSSVSSQMSCIGSSINVSQTVKKKRSQNLIPQASSLSADTESVGRMPLNQDVMQDSRVPDFTHSVSSSVTPRIKNSCKIKQDSKRCNTNQSASSCISKSRTAPDSQEDLSSEASKHSSATKQCDSRVASSSSGFFSHSNPNDLEVHLSKNPSISSISVALNVDAEGDAVIGTTALDGCQTTCPAGRTSMEDDVITSLQSTAVGHDSSQESLTASQSFKTSLTSTHNTESHETVREPTYSSSNCPGDSMDVDEAPSSSHPGVGHCLLHKDNQHSSKSMGDSSLLVDCTPPAHPSKGDVARNRSDYKVNSSSEAEIIGGDNPVDPSGSVESFDTEQGTSYSTNIAVGQEKPGAGEDASIQSTSASVIDEESSAHGKYDGLDEGSDFSDSDIDIDDLLDKDLPDEYKKPSKGKKRTVDGEEKPEEAGQQDGGGEEEPTPGNEPGVISFTKKTLLKKKGREPLEGLPEHWIDATHRSGMVVYIHRKTRVCTWSRPYFLGPGSVRKHRVPLAAIPCLHYMRAKQEEEGKSGHDKRLCTPSSSSSGDDAGGTAAENSRAECPGTSQPSEGQSKTDGSKSVVGSSGNREDTTTADEGKKDTAAGEDDDPYKNKVQMRADETLEPEELNAYARKVFEFDDVVVRRFQKWADKRKFWKSQKAKEVVDRPQLPAVPTFEVEMPSMMGNKTVRTKECALNMKDKTPIAILHEYCQKVLRAHPKYVVEESNNAHHPFEAVVYLEGTKYGRGQAQSKKVARLNAARQTLEILLPEVMARWKQDQDNDDSIEFFNQISIDDPRVLDLCSKTGQMTPFGVLQDYQQRMHGQSNSKLDFQVSVNKYQKLEYTMKLGPHEAKGPCKSRKVGKQLGAQQILKHLYPKITTWGGIIKLYGKGVDEINKAKREEQKKILALSKKQKNKPNEKILEKLKAEMRILYGPQRSSDSSSTPASIAPSGILSSQAPAEERSSQDQSPVDT